MEHTILSKKDLAFLEAVITEYGYVASISELKSLFGDLSFNELHHRLRLLVKRGWLIRIKQGHYVVANLESHNFSNVSPFIISRIFIPDSYVSFEYALNYHGYFDQLPGTVTAVTAKNSRRYKFQGMGYHFVKAKPEMFTGYKSVLLDGKEGRVANIEKVILDYLHFRKDSYIIDLILEKLLEAREVISTDMMIEYADLYPISVQRRLGFLLDLRSMDSSLLHNKIKQIAGVAKLSKDADQFNSKWRIYYENRITEQGTAFYN